MAHFEISLIGSLAQLVIEWFLKLFQKRRENPILDVVLYYDGKKRHSLYYCGESGKTYDIGKGDMPIMCEFVWNYKLEIRNNSSHTAYRVKIAEQKPQSNTMKIDFSTGDVTIKANEACIVDCIISHRQVMTAHESSMLFYNEETHYPFFLKDDNIAITISYTNESKLQFLSQICIDKNSDIQKYKPLNK